MDTITLTPGQRYQLTWCIPCMTAGASEPQTEFVTVGRVDDRFVDGRTDSGASVVALPVGRITAAREAARS